MRGITSPNLSAGQFAVFFTLANILVYNFPLFSYGVANLDYFSLNGLLTLLTMLVVVFAITSAVLHLLALLSANILKAFCIAIVICNSIAIYFMSTYHVVLDRSMMGNVLNTRSSESLEFLSFRMLIFILVLGIIPAWLVAKVRIKEVKRFRILFHLVLTLVLGSLWIYGNASTSLWIDKHASKLGSMVLPWSYVVNTTRLQLARRKANAKQELLPLLTSNENERSVVVLVIGEAARARNFSLYGYQRNTNPLLSKTGAVAVKDATSCSTYTTASIHCMLAHDGAPGGSYEPLPSYLQRNGVDVIWRSNNWGEPKIKVQSYEESTELSKSCKEKNCDFDEVLLSGLVARIQASKSRQVFVVLHTKGSHGPSYYTKYPEEFSVFEPVCKSVELDKCTQQELINAYDNTILYTDYFLNQTIERLKSLGNTPAALIYVSDHGESLGEYGLYLHGTPYSIAPDVQKNIPFIIWMSDSFSENRTSPNETFSRGTNSHEHVFHSVMGAFGMNSAVYDSELDVFHP